jgi:hypothetical protein
LGKTFETQKLSATEPKQMAEQIKMFLARELADCWSMFGEGKLQIFSRQWTFNGPNVAGIICDKIEFDKTVLYGNGGNSGPATSSNGGLKKIDGFFNYLASRAVPTRDISYMDYIRNTPQGDSAAELYGPLVSDIARAETKRLDSLDLTVPKSIFYVETTRSNAGKMVAGGVVAIGTVALSFWAPARVAMNAIMAISSAGVVGRAIGVSGAALAANAISWTGDTAQSWFEVGALKDQNAVGGIILTDYNEKGFSQYNINEFANLPA